jgi:hypothetical protein
LTKLEPKTENEHEHVLYTARASDYTRLLHTGGGFYCTITLSSFAILCDFLVQQNRLSPSPCRSSSSYAPPRILLHTRLHQLTDLFICRLTLDTTSVKWYLMLSIALRHADALERGENGWHGVLEGAKRGIKASAEVLDVENSEQLGGEQVLREMGDLNGKNSKGQLGQDTARENLSENNFIMQGQD